MKEVVAVLWSIRSVHNVGSMFRTADAAGVSKMYLCGITPTPLDRFGRFRRDFTKVALGAERSVPWEHVRAAGPLLKRLKREGFSIFAVEQSPRAVPYYRLETDNSRLAYSAEAASAAKAGRPAAPTCWTGRDGQAKPKTALVLGNEVTGLPPAAVKAADAILEIPMRGAVVRQACHPRHTGRGKESLNVAVAFGIVAYHLLHQRRS